MGDVCVRVYVYVCVCVCVCVCVIFEPNLDYLHCYNSNKQSLMILTVHPSTPLTLSLFTLRLQSWPTKPTLRAGSK